MFCSIDYGGQWVGKGRKNGDRKTARRVVESDLKYRD